MFKKDQMPSGGCDRCGAYAGEPQHVLRNPLGREHDAWLCCKCIEDLDKEYGVRG